MSHCSPRICHNLTSIFVVWFWRNLVTSMFSLLKRLGGIRFQLMAKPDLKLRSSTQMILCTGSLKISSRGAHVKEFVQKDAVVKRTRTGWIAALSSLVKAVSATHSCFKSPAVMLRIVKSALTQTILMIQWPILTPTLTWAVTLKHPAAPSMILFRMMILMLSQRENSDYPSMITIYF